MDCLEKKGAYDTCLTKSYSCIKINEDNTIPLKLITFFNWILDARTKYPMVYISCRSVNVTPQKHWEYDSDNCPHLSHQKKLLKISKLLKIPIKSFQKPLKHTWFAPDTMCWSQLTSLHQWVRQSSWCVLSSSFHTFEQLYQPNKRKIMNDFENIL